MIPPNTGFQQIVSPQEPRLITPQNSLSGIIGDIPADLNEIAQWISNEMTRLVGISNLPLHANIAFNERQERRDQQMRFWSSEFDR